MFQVSQSFKLQADIKKENRSQGELLKKKLDKKKGKEVICVITTTAN